MSSTLTTAAAVHLDDVLAQLRPEVREQHVYAVPTPPDTAAKMNQNELPYDLPPSARAEVLNAVAELAFHRYPEDYPSRLRQALAEHTGHVAEGVLVGNGSNELTHTLMLTFGGAGRTVLLPRPMFALYGSAARLFGSCVVSVGPREDFSFDVDGLVEAARAERPQLTVVATPNNPTGLAMTFEEVEALAEACAPGCLVVDEAYAGFVDTPSALTLLDRLPNVIVLRTFSKGFGLAGMRLGALLGHPELIGEMMKARLPFVVDRVAEAAALALLRRPELVEARVRAAQEATEALHDAVAKLPGVEVCPSIANFFLFRVEGRQPAELMQALSERGVLVRDVSGYPELRGWLRVSAGTDAENRALLDALQAELG